MCQPHPQCSLHHLHNFPRAFHLDLQTPLRYLERPTVSGHLKISCEAMAKLAVRFLESTAKSSSVAVRFLPRCKNKA